MSKYGIENDTLIDLETGKPKELELNVSYSYPYNPEYDYYTIMERINLDEEKDHDLATGNGFIISSPKATIKKDIKDPDGIFSPRYGQKLGDLNPFADRYSCECGNLKSRINHGIECPLCHTKCKYVDDNFHMFGWIVLIDKYHAINPDLYKSLEFFFGQSKVNVEQRNAKKGFVLQNILFYNIQIDQDGHESEVINPPANEPFFGIGMISFYERFDEIMEYYLNKNPKKKPYYDDIMADRDKVFTHSIPVFTTHLRPADIRDNNMFYESINGIYNVINKQAHRINSEKTRMQRNPKLKNQYLYRLQMKFIELRDEIVNICNGKKGQLRSLVAGRYNFSARAVIVQNPQLRIDQIKLPYTMLVIILQPQIINLLTRIYNIGYDEAYNIWYRAKATRNDRVADIITSIINNSTPDGYPVIFNRNPTISYGSILQLFCVGFNYDMVFEVPLQILAPLAADFDGDSLNLFLIINKIFFQRCYEIFNPRNAMYISRNDGMINPAVLVQRDTLINANTLLWLGRNNYTPEQLEKIKEIKEKQKKLFGMSND